RDNKEDVRAVRQSARRIEDNMEGLFRADVPSIEDDEHASRDGKFTAIAVRAPVRLRPNSFEIDPVAQNLDLRGLNPLAQQRRAHLFGNRHDAIISAKHATFQRQGELFEPSLDLADFEGRIDLEILHMK